MIFAAFGTSIPFPRLMRKLKDLAPLLNEELVVQAGNTPGEIPGATVFRFSPHRRPQKSFLRKIVRRRHPITGRRKSSLCTPDWEFNWN